MIARGQVYLQMDLGHEILPVTSLGAILWKHVVVYISTMRSHS